MPAGRPVHNADIVDNDRLEKYIKRSGPVTVTQVCEMFGLNKKICYERLLTCKNLYQSGRRDREHFWHYRDPLA